MKLRGKVAVVTGASRGIGRAIARAFLAEGARVAGCSRNLSDGPRGSFLDEAPDAPGSDSVLFGCDVRNATEVERFAVEVLDRFGPAAILVNNAGTVARGDIEQVSEAEWDEVLDANLKGSFLVTRAFLPALKQTPGGRIINLASVSGRQGTAGLVAYCSAKHGVVGFTRALAEELRPVGIPVNAICPGSVDTDMLKIGMPGAHAAMSADDVARVALFLAADAPPQLTGSCLDVFG